MTKAACSLIGGSLKQTLCTVCVCLQSIVTAAGYCTYRSLVIICGSIQVAPSSSARGKLLNDRSVDVVRPFIFHIILLICVRGCGHVELELELMINIRTYGTVTVDETTKQTRSVLASGSLHKLLLAPGSLHLDHIYK
jgi:hypothetical protein